MLSGERDREANSFAVEASLPLCKSLQHRDYSPVQHNRLALESLTDNSFAT